MNVFLACGITPLHVETFLRANLRVQFPNHRVTIETGLFGDLAGSLAALETTHLAAVAVVIEWTDLDPRLGFRHQSNWRAPVLPDILRSAAQAAVRLQQLIGRTAGLVPMCISLPTLPLPPVAWSRPHEASAFELELRYTIADFARALAKMPGVRMVQQDQLARLCPAEERYDLRSDLMTGCPFTTAHASIVAGALSNLIENRQPKKGIITDLDGTLWAGIVGEDGVDGISWTLENHTQEHGLYQQLLASLASAGVLIGVASKNDTDVVERAFNREDLGLTRGDIFPFEVHWSRKSESVERILQAWNVSADSVVFIDDRAEEVAEVQSAYPQMECIVFPQLDFPALLKLFTRLRDTFGKASLSEEDAIRLSSLRNSPRHDDGDTAVEHEAEGTRSSLNARITFANADPDSSTRGYELLNKTNQFNLNGHRYSEAEWRRLIRDETATTLLVSYQDRYGPLGTIAVMVGRVAGDSFLLESWVMSCRAFARQIEHHCLKYLFDALSVDSIQLKFQPTPRNTPLQKFLTGMLGTSPSDGVALRREDFFHRTRALHHLLVAPEAKLPHLPEYVYPL